VTAWPTSNDVVSAGRCDVAQRAFIGRPIGPGRVGGDLPSPANAPDACRFHTRCPFVQPTRCADEELRLRELNGHVVACRFAEAIKAGEIKPVAPGRGRDRLSVNSVRWRRVGDDEVGLLRVAAEPRAHVRTYRDHAEATVT
jgi:hypothetical protein